MKRQTYFAIIICIIVFFCSSCSITRQTTCPNFTNKTEKIHKPLFSKKQSPRKDKKQLSKVTDQAKKEKPKKNRLTRIENVISKIELNDIMASSDNEITLNSTDIAPIFIESKLHKLIYKKIEKKTKKDLKNLEKQNQKKNAKANHKKIISTKKKYKKKRKKTFNNKDNNPTDKREINDFAIMSMLAGILIFVTPIFEFLIGGWFFALAILLISLAINWGKKGKKQIKKNPSKYEGEEMASIGIALGIISICVLILYIISILPPLFSFSFDYGR